MPRELARAGAELLESFGSMRRVIFRAGSWHFEYNDLPIRNRDVTARMPTEP